MLSREYEKNIEIKEGKEDTPVSYDLLLIK